MPTSPPFDSLGGHGCDRRAQRVRGALDRRRTRAVAAGIVMALDDVDLAEADARITADAARHHLDIDSLAAMICRSGRHPGQDD